MGYYVATTEVSCQIPQVNLNEAVGILAEYLPDKNYESDYERLNAILRGIGFDDNFLLDDGGLGVGGYDGKSHHEEADFKAIAHLIPDGCYLSWRGEEGCLYQWSFEEGKLVERHGTVVWE